jgi:hypothetical protein
MPPKRDAIARRRRRIIAPKMKLKIHHQFPGIELVSPVYAVDGATRYMPLDQRVDVGSTVQTGFNIDTDQKESIGVLLYTLQKKNTDQPNEEESTCVQLVIIWKVNSSKEFCVNLFLIEHDKDRIWDGDGLMELAEHYKLTNIQHVTIEETWLMHDNTVLMIRSNKTSKGDCYELEATISETSIKEDTQRLRYIGWDR